MGSQRQDDFINLERRRDREVSLHTMHASRSHSRGGSHVSQEQNARAMHNESELLPILMFPLMMKRMLAIDKGQEPHPVSLSPIMRSTITNEGIKARLAEAWVTTL